MVRIKVHFQRPSSFIPWCGAPNQIIVSNNLYKTDARVIKNQKEVNCQGCRKLIKKARRKFKL